MPGNISIAGSPTSAGGKPPGEQQRRVKAADVRECDQNVARGRRDPDGPLDAVHRKHQAGGRGRGLGYDGGTVRHGARAPAPDIDWDPHVLVSRSLLQERMEMARMAEEVARQTAEMAIRQLASEGQSIKLSLGSQELLEEPEVE